MPCASRLGASATSTLGVDPFSLSCMRACFSCIIVDIVYSVVLVAYSKRRKENQKRAQSGDAWDLWRAWGRTWKRVSLSAVGPGDDGWWWSPARRDEPESLVCVEMSGGCRAFLSVNRHHLPLVLAGRKYRSSRQIFSLLFSVTFIVSTLPLITMVAAPATGGAAPGPNATPSPNAGTATKLVTDPHTEVCPDYSLDTFASLRAPLLAAGLSEADAAKSLTDIWGATNAANCVLWDAQLAQEQQQEQVSDPRGSASPSGVQAGGTQNDPARVADSGLNRAVKSAIVVDPALSTPDSLRARHARYVDQQMEKRTYFQLDYLTAAGRSKAQALGLNNDASDALKVESSADGGMQLTHAPSAAPLKGVREDKDLSLEEQRQAGLRWIQLMADNGWGDDVVRMWSTLLLNIELYPTRDDWLGKPALALYLDRVRKHWYAELHHNRPYDVSTVNPDLLRSLTEELVQSARSGQLQPSATVSDLSYLLVLY